MELTSDHPRHPLRPAVSRNLYGPDGTLLLTAWGPTAGECAEALRQCAPAVASAALYPEPDEAIALEGPDGHYTLANLCICAEGGKCRVCAVRRERAAEGRW